MVKLKKRGVVFADTPLIEGLYVVKGGSLLQIRVRGIQIVMSAVSSYEELVECGKRLVKRYKTIENLRKLLKECEYVGRVSERLVTARQSEEEQALESDLHRDWYRDVLSQPVVETEVLKSKPKRIKLKLK